MNLFTYFWIIDQNHCKASTTVQETLACTTFDHCPIVDTVGDNVISGAEFGDKYSLEMDTTCKSDHLCLTSGAIENKIQMAQNKQLFGFIPIYGLQSRITDTNTNSVCTDILLLHELLRQNGRHNYNGLQIPLHSQLNFEKWKSYLQDYWDWQLPLLIKYGFPLDYNRTYTIQNEKN